MVKSGLVQLALHTLNTLVVCVMMFVKVEGSNMDVVNLTFIKTAVREGAVCLDGSPPAYQFDRGFGDGINNWLVHMQGGGICISVEDCLLRTNSSNGLGSSKLMKESNFTGILSNKQAQNPNFYNWNRVLVRYCDGSCFTGDVKEVDPTTKLHFRGARIFKAVVKDLLKKGMKNAQNTLLSGCSAGGSATIIHCDRFRAYFPTRTRVKCAPDAGYFSHVKDLSGNYYFEDIVKQAVTLHGSEKILPHKCTSKKSYLCFYPQCLMPYIQTPIFVLNSAYDSWQVENILALKPADPNGSFTECRMDLHKCSSSQLKRLKEFRSDFLEILYVVRKRSYNGMFINTCYTHCQTETQTSWFGDPASKLDKKAIAEALAYWYYDKGAFQKIDKKNVMPHYCAL